MRSRVVAALAGCALVASLAYVASESEAHAGCIHRCTVRVLAGSQYPETVDTRCARICSEVP